MTNCTNVTYHDESDLDMSDQNNNDDNDKNAPEKMFPEKEAVDIPKPRNKKFETHCQKRSVKIKTSAIRNKREIPMHATGVNIFL